jgi:Pectate lyase superfamily protein
MIDVKSDSAVDLSQYLYAPNEGVCPDTGEDLAEKLDALFDKSHAMQKGIYFPEGVYLTSKDAIMKSHNSLRGAMSGTVFRGISASGNAVMFGDATYENTVTNLSIRNIIFDNARVHFYGRKTNINVSYNVFINTVTATDMAQLTCSTNAYVIKGNVFMRGRGYAGVGLSTYGNAPGLVVEQNFLGSVTDIDAATPWIDGETQAILATLLERREAGLMTFDDAQGDFVAGWYSTSNLRKGVFRKNFFTGSKEMFLYNPATGEEDIQRDHNIYIKQYDQVEVVQNYFAGWPGDHPSGQLKFRNAKGLVFAGNYLLGTSFNARPYNTVADQWLIMQDTYIFNNYLDDGIISYWQNFVDSEVEAIRVENYLVFANEFINREATEAFITSPARTFSADQFLCAENRFVESGALGCVP